MKPTNRQLRRRQAIAGGAGVSVMMLSGCLSMLREPAIENIEIRISDVRAPSIGATSLTLPLILEFINTGGTEVPNISMEAAVNINNAQVATARTSAGSLNSGERSQTRMNTIVEYSQAGAAIVDAIRTGSFRILLDGILHSDGPFFDASRRFRSQAST